MGAAAGPKSITDGLIFTLDSGANFRGFTKYGTAGTNNSNRSAVNLIDKSTIDISNTSNIVTSLSSPANQYTMYGLTYPEGSQTPASRHGITPGFNNTSATKTYSHSRDLGYFVFDDSSNSWVANSYFNGERINGHAYDTYDGEPDQHQKFQDDHAAIHAAFPNATHIIIGSHAAENNDNDTDTLAILQSLGLPDSHIGVARPEYILIGKKNKPSTQSYVRENVSSTVAHLNVLLPLDQTKGALSFDGTDDFINISGTSDLASDLRLTGNVTIECVCKPDSQNNGNMFAMATNNGYRMRVQSNNDLWIYSNGNSVSGGNMTVNTWHHCVGVFSDTGLRLYQNNSLVSSNSSAYSPATASWGSQGAVIGGYTTTSELFDGSISVVKIYNRALTAEEVSRNYNAYKNRFNL